MGADRETSSGHDSLNSLAEDSVAGDKALWTNHGRAGVHWVPQERLRLQSVTTWKVPGKALDSAVSSLEALRVLPPWASSTPAPSLPTAWLSGAGSGGGLTEQSWHDTVSKKQPWFCGQRGLLNANPITVPTPPSGLGLEDEGNGNSEPTGQGYAGAPRTVAEPGPRSARVPRLHTHPPGSRLSGWGHGPAPSTSMLARTHYPSQMPLGSACYCLCS